MTEVKKITIPSLGDTAKADVIEVCVQPGQQVAAEATLLVLEGEKATMDIPCPYPGTIDKISIKVGDVVTSGDLILTLHAEEVEVPEVTTEAEPEQAVLQTVTLPDLGDGQQANIVEITVKPGDQVNPEQTLVVLEGEKATMDIPSPYQGTVKDILVKMDEVVKTGTAILTMEALPGQSTPEVQQPAESSTEPQAPVIVAAPLEDTPSGIKASPSVRRLARELDISLSTIRGTGAGGRVLKADLVAVIKSRMQGAVAPSPEIDFSVFGAVDRQPLSKIKRITGERLHRNWTQIPHVTQFDQADITALEAYRKKYSAEAKAHGIRLTPLVFIMKAVVECLKAMPTFNASLSADGQDLILKQYFHLGIAVDTPKGLVVPVIQDVDQKDVITLADELVSLSEQARTKGLAKEQMQGSSMSISSLGGIGGEYFTPIINAPDVAILGVSRSRMQPVYTEGAFEPRLMLPLSLSYDHRVIDGAEGARMMQHLVEVLASGMTSLDIESLLNDWIKERNNDAR